MTKNMNSVCIKDFSGYIQCKSSFGEHMITCSGINCIFDPGITLLQGDIDSGNWAISYTISMYKQKSRRFILFPESSLTLDSAINDLKTLTLNACYLDSSHVLFSSHKTIHKLVEKGLKSHKDCRNSSQIRDLFNISADRFERPLCEVGNEKFRCMAAIGYANQKRIYCFPWLSKKSVEYYGRNIMDVLETLNSLKEFVVIPSNSDFSNTSFFKRVYNLD